MHLKTIKTGCGLTFYAEGELRGINAVLLLNRIQSIELDSVHKVTVDITSVTYIDSTALGGLIYCHKILEKQGKRLCLVDSLDHALSLFRGCPLERVLHLVEPQAP